MPSSRLSVAISRPTRRGAILFAARVAAGVFALALVTGVCYRLELNVATTGFLFLLLVMAQSLFSGLAASAILSLIAAGCLDYFFVPPVLQWQISDPTDTVALTTFLVTALLITNLQARARNEMRRAERRGVSLSGLYEVTHRLLAIGPEADLTPSLLQTFRTVFQLRAVCLYDGATGETHTDGESICGLQKRTRDACLSGVDADDRIADVSVRYLRPLGTGAGAIGFEKLTDPALTASALAALAVSAFERVRAAREASSAALAAETEAFRGILLDVLAHEFKTPLAAISTAAGGIREAGPLRQEQLEMAGTIEAEASRLGSLTTRLLRVARLDRAEVNLNMERLNISSLVARTVCQHANRLDGREVSYHTADRTAEALVDGELLGLALSQLLDNAVKYSSTGAPIAVALTAGRDAIAIRVSNPGNSIPPGEEERLFERFYRGPGAQQIAPGTGLGLYVARKIVLAHGGSLVVDNAHGNSASTVFCLRLPAAGSEPAREIALPEQ